MAKSWASRLRSSLMIGVFTGLLTLAPSRAQAQWMSYGAPYGGYGWGGYGAYGGLGYGGLGYGGWGYGGMGYGGMGYGAMGYGGMGYGGMGYGGWGYGGLGYGGYGYPGLGYGYGGLGGFGYPRFGYGGWGGLGWGGMGGWGFGMPFGYAAGFEGGLTGTPPSVGIGPWMNPAVLTGLPYINPYFGVGLSPLAVQTAVTEHYAFGGTGARRIPTQRIRIRHTPSPAAVKTPIAPSPKSQPSSAQPK